jgi:hypothetical protein
MGKLPRAALLAALVLSLVASGCGDTADKNEYVDLVNKAQTDFADGVGKLQGTTSEEASAKEQAKAVFDQLQASVDKIVADLKAVEAPEEVKAQHDTLIEEIGKFDTAIGKASASLAGGSMQDILEAQTTFAAELADVGTNITATIAQINQKLQE